MGKVSTDPHSTDIEADWSECPIDWQALVRKFRPNASLAGGGLAYRTIPTDPIPTIAAVIAPITMYTTIMQTKVTAV